MRVSLLFKDDELINASQLSTAFADYAERIRTFESHVGVQRVIEAAGVRSVAASHDVKWASGEWQAVNEFVISKRSLLRPPTDVDSPPLAYLESQLRWDFVEGEITSFELAASDLIDSIELFLPGVAGMAPVMEFLRKRRADYVTFGRDDGSRETEVFLCAGSVLACAPGLSELGLHPTAEYLLYGTETDAIIRARLNSGATWESIPMIAAVHDFIERRVFTGELRSCRIASAFGNSYTTVGALEWHQTGDDRWTYQSYLVGTDFRCARGRIRGGNLQVEVETTALTGMRISATSQRGSLN